MLALFIGENRWFHVVFDGFRFGFVGREIRVQTVRQGVPVETKLEETHPRGPLRQRAATRVSALRHELQTHQSPEQARHTVPAHPVRRQPDFDGVHVCDRDRDRVNVVVVVRVHRAAHSQTAAAVSRRIAHHCREHRDHRDVVTVADHTGVAFEKPEFDPKLDFQYPKVGQLKTIDFLIFFVFFFFFLTSILYLCGAVACETYTYKRPAYYFVSLYRFVLKKKKKKLRFSSYPRHSLQDETFENLRLSMLYH